MKIKTIIMLLSFLTFSGSALADTETAYLATGEGLTTLSALAVKLAQCSGIVLIFMGTYGFFGREENKNNYSIRFCMASLISGALLVSSGYFYAVVANSGAGVAWANDSTLLSINPNVNSATGDISSTLLGQYMPEASLNTIFGFLYLVGLCFFLYGTYLIQHIGDAHAPQGKGTSSCFWHIVGGLILMNITDAGCFIQFLTGLPYLCISS